MRKSRPKDKTSGTKEKQASAEPASPRSLLALLDTLTPLEEDFPSITELPNDPVDF